MRIHPLWVFVTLFCSMPASAHHSIAIYATETTTLEGDVVDVLWANPHVSIRVRDPGGQVWRLEGGSLMTLQRSGVTRDLLHEGDHVKAAVRVSRREPLLAGVSSVLLPDGREAQFLTGAPPYSTDPARLIKGVASRVMIDTALENRGIYRVWSVPAPNPVGADALLRLPFTPAAVEARKSFDLYDNFATRCEPEGMPRILFNPHPFEFIDHGATITQRTEFYDTERIIHMDGAAPPAGEPTSRLGYSVGKWDGGALIVSTTLVSWPFFDNIGSPQSGAVRIVERYSLSQDQGRLDFRVTVTDPTTFTAPAVVDDHWLALGGTIPRYDCRPER